jgi:hypothetical protein
MKNLVLSTRPCLTFYVMPQPQVRQKNQGGKRMLPFFGYFVDVVANWQEPSNFGIRRDSRPSRFYLFGTSPCPIPGETRSALAKL